MRSTQPDGMRKIIEEANRRFPNDDEAATAWAREQCGNLPGYREWLEATERAHIRSLIIDELEKGAPDAPESH